ncbi:HpcH/HpaI aldolase family protein [Caldalkalibacillus uzonensis]|nr:aldolase/citrate lyase family protein [Caldalkalibacillus uzonensis]
MLKKRLAIDELILSTMISEVRNPNLARMLATAGLDSIIIDMEHGTFSWPEMSAMITVAKGAGVAPVVRIPEIRRETILKPLDAGAAGILVPMVNSVEEAKEVIQHVKYPPDGKRGAALRRGHSDYRAVSAADYMKQANEEIAVLLQVETMEAVHCAPELAQVEGVDALFIGPFDLSVDMGIPGKIWDKSLRQIYSDIISACKQRGVAVGIQSFDIEQARELVNLGVRYLSFSSDVNMLVDQTASAVKQIHQKFVV